MKKKREEYEFAERACGWKGGFGPGTESTFSKFNLKIISPLVLQARLRVRCLQVTHSFPWDVTNAVSALAHSAAVPFSDPFSMSYTWNQIQVSSFWRAVSFLHRRESVEPPWTQAWKRKPMKRVPIPVPFPQTVPLGGVVVKSPAHQEGKSKKDL